MDNRPIGLFDSGVGGLTVLNDLKKMLPNESFVYLADNLNLNYGEKSNPAITDISLDCAYFLLDQNVKAIVIACNTVSGVAINAVRNAAKTIPVFGMIEAGAKAAVKISINGRIGIIATHATIRNSSFKKEINKYTTFDNLRVYEREAQYLVNLVESGQIDNEFAHSEIRKAIGPLIDYGIDSLILGCTHFPILSDIININYPNIKQVVPGYNSAISCRDYLIENNLHAENKSARDLYCYTKFDPLFTKKAKDYFDIEIIEINEVSI